jgi:activator of HSP90 ATPase
MKNVVREKCARCDNSSVANFPGNVSGGPMNTPLLQTARILSRRRAGGAILAALGAASLGRAQMPQQPKEQTPCTSPNQALTTIHYDLDFKASPERFYQAILDEKRFTAFSGMPASIDATQGGAISMFGGMIVGRNVELIPNQRIVQAWRPTHWDAGVYSIIHFELKPGGAGTSLSFDHTGFPSGVHDSLDWGWKNHYWEPLGKYFS